jgi:transposase
MQPITKKGKSVMNVTRIGLDLAKQVFQVHGVDLLGQAVLRKQLTRGKLRAFFAQIPRCLVGMEACGSAHYWARELAQLGHEVRLMAPQFVAPYRKEQKNDGNDAEAICEAVARPSMRFVPVKTVEQQAVLTVHRARQLLVGERTALVNHVRGLLAEYGIVLGQGVAQLRRCLPEILEDAENGLPVLAREVFSELQERLRQVDQRVHDYDRRIACFVREMPAAQRLMQLEGIGPISATALVATVGEAREFANGRQFAAWLGLVPRQYSSGGKARHGRITKRGDRYLRTLLVHGARAVLIRSAGRKDPKSQWCQGVRARRGFNKATVALAAKHARILWAMLARAEDYRPAPTRQAT